MAGRTSLLQARDDGPHRCPAMAGGGGPGTTHGELTRRREDDALRHHVPGLDPRLSRRIDVHATRDAWALWLRLRNRPDVR